ncbi:MAG: hypothetical protein QNK21_01410, partial [Desulfosarcina sp.]|nr:hypothetical protein [Desulfosarcina sp.]MDX2489102.1 hypothetical protein [Desulfosarcina sp.]
MTELLRYHLDRCAGAKGQSRKRVPQIRAERALRFGVLWRKRSLGTQSEKGGHWVERILSLKETCRLRSKQTYP